ncbi:group III truncated hemoglobin [Sulfurovum sp.]|uniref:group III truncated hemoglobin n=1 Tax=Sulfurovum sp. TaxID=1969726 RepID=UPI0028681B4F|nr:group III truncated hemoglobin [Sulfurovum sp.]
MFYHKAMKDAQIGHFFILELGDDITSEDWTEHIDTLVNFWATVFLDDTLYYSDPYGPHFSIVGLQREDFTRWIELFSQSADQVYMPQMADLFKEKGIFYSKDFMQRLNSDNNAKDFKSAVSWG